MRIAAILLPLVFVATLAACDKKSPPAPSAAAPAARACSSNTDCNGGWVCLDGKCADMRAGAVYRNTDEAVTPDKVKKEVEKIQAKHEAAFNKATTGPEL